MTSWGLIVALPGAALLACFLVRRLLFVIAALVPTRRVPRAASVPPSVTLIVPARGEGATIGATLDALDALEYQPDRLSIVLVNDGSRDSTGERFAAWAAGRGCVQVLDLVDGAGKFEALNRAIRVAPRTDCIAVCDGDLRPRPSWLAKLVEPFTDPAVGATAGFLSPVNADAGPVARYAAVETWTHQLVTSAAKDTLGLDPPTLGACAYRRTALEGVGWFRGAGPGEDVQISAELVRAGWRTRFVADAIADNPVVARLDDYWHQHVRWGRNVLSAARARPRSGRPARLGPARRVESWMAAAGYADRLALVVVAAASVAGLLPLWLPAVYLAAVAAEVVVAIGKAGAARRLPVLLVTTATLFALDVVASGAAVLAHVLGRPRGWRSRKADVRASAELE